MAWVAKLSEQRVIFKNLLSFCLCSLLHGIIKTFIIKSITRSDFVQYKHYTLSYFVQYSTWPGVVACTCNPATLEAKFRNSVSLIPVEGNSPSIGGWIV